MKWSSSLSLLSWFAPPFLFLSFFPAASLFFRCFLPSSRCTAAFLHQRLLCLHSRVRIYSRCICICLFFLLMFSSALCAQLKSLSHCPSLSKDPSVTVETCREAVTELHNSLRRTVKLYTQVSQSVCGCVRERGATEGKIQSKCQVYVSFQMWK